LHQWEWLLATAFITFLYSAPKIPFPPFNHLKKIAVGKTIFLSLVWTHTTAILPLVLSNVHWQDQHFLFVINRFFLIYPICILFDYRDREEDKREGIKSMITHFSEKGIKALFYSSLLIFFKWLKGGKGILGAEYKKVIKAVASNHSQWCSNRIQNQPAPIKPMIKNMKCVFLFRMDHWVL
jgi:hypothetical protein